MTNSLLTQPDFEKFQTKDPEWFLDAVADTVRTHCQWHISPVISCVNHFARVGNKGIVLLPSLHIVSVEAVRVMGALVDSSAYEVHADGWIELVGVFQGLSVAVDFTHGYDVTPKVVAEVGYELAATVLEKASGVVTDLTRGPVMMKFKEFGIALTPGQEERLQPFRLRRV